jgi:hypothetical protein
MIATMRDDPAKRRLVRRSHDGARLMTATSRGTATRKPPRVGLVVYDGVTAFELGVAREIFGDDQWLTSDDPWYRFFICGDGAAPVRVGSGFTMQVPHGLERLRHVDTVIAADGTVRSGARCRARRPAPRRRRP